MVVTPTQLTFLIYALSTVQRWAESGRLPTIGARAALRLKFVQDLWDFIDEDSPIVAIVPGKPLIQVIIPHLEFGQTLSRMGIRPPPDLIRPDGWDARFLNHAQRILDGYNNHYGRPMAGMLIPMPCQYEDVVKLFGTAYGIRESTSDTSERASMDELLPYLRVFLDPESSQQAARMGVQPPGASRASSSTSRPTSSGQSARPSQAPEATTLECLYCNSQFVTADDKPKCPNCDPFFQDWVVQRGSTHPAEAHEAAFEWERLGVRPPLLPLVALVVAGVISLILAFALYILDGMRLYVVMLYPIALGFPVGFVMGRLIAATSLFVRTFYWLMPITLALLAYASIFYIDYEHTIYALEQEGWASARELISFTSHVHDIASYPVELTRHTWIHKDEYDDPANWYILWFLEACVVALSANRGWKRGIRSFTGQDT